MKRRFQDESSDEAIKCPGTASLEAGQGTKRSCACETDADFAGHAQICEGVAGSCRAQRSMRVLLNLTQMGQSAC